MISDICKRANSASCALAVASTDDKNAILREIQKQILTNSSRILSANEIDVKSAIQNNLATPMVDRLRLDQKSLQNLADSIDNVINLPDPVGAVLESWNVAHNGLSITKKTCPIGTIAIIYESRPNVTIDAAILCLKSGNSCVLRGGSECINTNRELVKSIRAAFEMSDFANLQDCVSFVDSASRDSVIELLKYDEYLDLVIPRGGKGLVKAVSENSRIPVLKHLDGNCHTYIENSADINRAISVLVNAKMRKVSVCGATESLVIDRKIATTKLSEIVSSLFDAGCGDIFGDAESCALDSRVKSATDEDYYCEYLDSKISIKIVEDIDEAIAHINKYSSKHTDAILSEDARCVSKFFGQIDSANVLHNASTQFADGFEFGFGAEIGISTGKLHARGPVALKELVTYKYLVSGDYAIRR